MGAALLAYANLPDRYRPLIDYRFLTSREQRLIHFFGECEPAGYGYLKRVLATYTQIEPNSGQRPIIRYRNYNRRSEYLFEPTRFKKDPSILVGVGLGESDMQAHEISRASPGADGLWRFPVESNFDLLTHIEVEVANGSTDDLRLQLYLNERAPKPVWTSVASLATDSETGGTTLQFVPMPALRAFRSGLVDAFVIRIDEDVSIRSATAYGVVINIEGYRVVHREGACFTAVKDGQQDRWSRLIRELKGSID
jgi:hypothetical protein